MARFTTRVELHQSSPEGDYKKLNIAMAAEGFSKTITNDSTKVTYHLPTGEYSKTGVYSKSQVLESAINAASKTGKEFAVLVTKSDGRIWYNLTEKKIKFKTKS